MSNSSSVPSAEILANTVSDATLSDWLLEVINDVSYMKRNNGGEPLVDRDSLDSFSLFDNPLVDSLELLNLYTTLEREFQIVVSDRDLLTIRTIKDLKAHILNHGVSEETVKASITHVCEERARLAELAASRVSVIEIPHPSSKSQTN